MPTRTRIERTFEPEAVRRLKETSAADLSIGGATIASEAFRHGLVDERRFDNGVVYLRHAVRHR